MCYPMKTDATHRSGVFKMVRRFGSYQVFCVDQPAAKTDLYNEVESGQSHETYLVKFSIVTVEITKEISIQ